MADLVLGLAALWEADAGVAALIGDRFYPSTVPATREVPYARYQIISDTRVDALAAMSEVSEARVQIDAFALDYTVARAIVRALCVAIVPGEIAGVRFGAARYDRPVDGGEDGERGFIYRARADIMLWYRPA